MEQRYLFKKQIISIFFLLLCIVILHLCSLILYRNISILYLFVVLSITFTPGFRKILKYPYSLHYILYYSPMILPAVVNNMVVNSDYQVKYMLYGIGLGLFLFLTNFNYMKKSVSTSNIMLMVPMEKKRFFMSIYQFFIALISEELFFRLTLIGLLKVDIEIYSIFLSSIVFCHAHYINRWASKIFNLKSYIYHIIIGLSLGGMYYYTNSILSAIIAHAIFNLPQLIVNYKRYRKKNIAHKMFDDYGEENVC